MNLMDSIVAGENGPFIYAVCSKEEWFAAELGRGRPLSGERQTNTCDEGTDAGPVLEANVVLNDTASVSSAVSVCLDYGNHSGTFRGTLADCRRIKTRGSRRACDSRSGNEQVSRRRVWLGGRLWEPLRPVAGFKCVSHCHTSKYPRIR